MAVCATAATSTLSAIAIANTNSSFSRKPISSKWNPINHYPSTKLRDTSNVITASITEKKKTVEMGLIGLMAASSLLFGFPSEADATRIEYYATTAEPSCQLNVVSSGLAYCDLVVGSGVPAPYNTLINVHTHTIFLSY